MTRCRSRSRSLSAKLQSRPPSPLLNPSTSAPSTSTPSLQAPEDAPHLSPFIHPFSERADIVQPVARPAKLSKWSYNSNTLARDVLLAVGQHPERPRLNHHLLGLRDQFKYVNDDSDLGTLRWDLIHPGGLALSQSQYTSMTPIVRQQNSAEKYRLPFVSGNGDASSSVGEGVRQFSGYSSSAQGVSNSPGYGTCAGSYHAHPSPDGAIPRPYGSTSNGNTAGVSKALGTYSLPLQPSSSASKTQSSLSQFGYGTQRSNEAPSHSHGSITSKFEYRPSASNFQNQAHLSSGSQRPTQSYSTCTPSRFGYPEKPEQRSSHPVTASSPSNHGYPPKETLPGSRAAFRGSANTARPSHYQQSNLQYPSTPNQPSQPSPQSSLQVVIATSTPTQFYNKSPLPSYMSDSRSTSPPRRGRPPNNSLPTGRPFSTSLKKRGRSFAKNQPDEKISKKRGRPFRTAEAAIEAVGRKAGSRASSVPKKKGRPFKIRHHIDVEQPEPVFFPFICEWKNCRKELHNLETLRLHIHIMHKQRVDGKLPCFWRDCSVRKYVDREKDGEDVEGEESSEEVAVASVESAEKVGESVETARPSETAGKKAKAARIQFRSRQEWKEHIEDRHLIPFAWHMGDGPKGTDLSGKPKNTINPLWLIDSSGNQVTPSVANQPLEDGRASKNNAKRFRKMRGSEEYAIKDAKKASQRLGIGKGKDIAMAPAPLVGGTSEDEDTGMDGGNEDIDMEEVDMAGGESLGREVEDGEEDSAEDELAR